MNDTICFRNVLLLILPHREAGRDTSQDEAVDGSAFNTHSSLLSMGDRNGDMVGNKYSTKSMELFVQNANGAYALTVPREGGVLLQGE